MRGEIEEERGEEKKTRNGRRKVRGRREREEKKTRNGRR